jgi:nicotinate phosphoribosyltransferase
VAAGVPINGFGVGRHLATSSDVPVLDTAYKLAEYGGRPKMKLSESKSTLPGRKQVFRERSQGKAIRDVIGLTDETGVQGEPLLVKVMENGRRTQPPEPLEKCRSRCKAELNALPGRLMSLSNAHPGYDVKMSHGLTQLRAATLGSAKT